MSHAATVGSWALSNPRAFGASVIYDGSKGAVTSSAIISPNTSQLAKVLRGGIAGYALSFAIEELLGAVDWVMDPVNNSIRYKEKVSEIEPPFGKYEWQVSAVDPEGSQTEALSASQSCIKWAELIKKFYSGKPAHFVRLEEVKERGTVANAYCVTFPEGYGSEHTKYMRGKLLDPDAPREKSISLEVIAEKVIEHAENDNSNAQFAVAVAATDILSEAGKDDAKAKPIEKELEDNVTCRIDNILSKPARCDEEPEDLCEQLVLAEAKAGAGSHIMKGEIMNDEPRLIAHYGAGPWIKKQHLKICSNGKQKIIHYFHSLSSYKNVELKFKQR